ncbi:UNVERIFIED_CONTAM: hypothetical protein PYX00_011924 [Menopon gallinae]|uniref:Uncharacterized protein n=1 Tax=Menopon gallinae TaxID=328185 RepID=A0AAW2H8V6_9NEOP
MVVGLVVFQGLEALKIFLEEKEEALKIFLSLFLAVAEQEHSKTLKEMIYRVTAPKLVATVVVLVKLDKVLVSSKFLPLVLCAKEKEWLLNIPALSVEAEGLKKPKERFASPSILVLKVDKAYA